MSCQPNGSQKHIDDRQKTLQARLAILLLFMWLNLVTSTKLPTYPREGSSHHVVQQIFFFFYNFFFSTWLNSAKDTKLPMYPWEGSSYHVVQKIFFFFYIINFFFFFLCVFCKKGGAVCNSGYHHWSNPRSWPQGRHGHPTATPHSQLVTWSGINFSLLVRFEG